MHRSIGNIIADTLELSLGYSERLLSGISPERFSRFADVGGVIIHSNHPCFIYGHLSLYAPRVTEQLGQSAIAVSDRFSKVFSKDSICVDDPSSDYYPPFMEVISFFVTVIGSPSLPCARHRIHCSISRIPVLVGWPNFFQRWDLSTIFTVVDTSCHTWAS